MEIFKNFALGTSISLFLLILLVLFNPTPNNPVQSAADFQDIQNLEQEIEDEQSGLSLEINEQQYFLPFDETWNVLNLEIDEESLLVSYCDECNIGVAHSPYLEGEKLSFSASEELHEKMLVFIDSETQSQWAQISGEAISGSYYKKQLEILPHQNEKWEDWSRKYPEGKVYSPSK
jgi:hypothetical protein